MATRKRRYHNTLEEDKFETEAFEYLNEEKARTKETPTDDESDVDLEASDPEDVNEEDTLLDEKTRSDDDDAPDLVDFATGRNTVLQQFRLAKDQIELDKQKKRDKRKKLDTQYKDQKSQKLKDLSKTKLPDEFLESLASEIPKKQKKSSIAKENLKERRKKKEDSNDNSFDEQAFLEEERITADHDLDYIPLSGRIDRASGVEVMKLGQEQNKQKSAAESAAEFLKNRLYGSHIPRETTKQKMAKEDKRKARFR